MNVYKVGFGLVTLFFSGFSYYYCMKKYVIRNINLMTSGRNSMFGNYNACGDYPKIPFYLENDKEINEAIDKYKKMLITLIKYERIEMYELDEKFKQDKDFILQIMKETDNTFHMKNKDLFIYSKQ